MQLTELTLQNILLLAGKTTDAPFTPEEILLLKSKIQYLILQRKSNSDGVLFTSIISVRDIAIGYGKNIHSESTAERTVSISFNVIDTESKKDDERVYRIRRHGRYMYHFSILDNGEIKRSSSDSISDDNLSEAHYYIQ